MLLDSFTINILLHTTEINFKIYSNSKLENGGKMQMLLKVSEYAFTQNRSVLQNMTVLLFTYFFNVSLKVLRPTFLNICNLPFLRSPNIGKIRVKVGPKANYFSYFISSCTNRIAVFNTFFSLVCSQPKSKQNRARDFFSFLIFFE